MILFATDLDSTLIHSYKRAKKGDICIETKDGKKLSYMTEKAYHLLPEVAEIVEFVPVTTRSLEQYRRIQFFENKVPHYALVANGGLLLVNDKVDEEWFRDSKKMISHTEKELYKAMEILKKDPYITFEIRLVDELFVFTKTSEIDYTIDNLKKNLDLDLVNVLNNGIKIHVFPKCMNKGVAVGRLQEKVDFSRTISAGDSEFDVPMLETAHKAYVPNVAFKEKYMIKCPSVVIHNTEQFFGEFILTDLKKDLERT